MISIALALVMLGSCSENLAAADLEQMRDTWRRLEPVEYTYEVAFDCFCPEDALGPFQVAAQGGVTRVTGNGSVMDDSFLPVDPDIASLFGFIEANLGADLLEVRYSSEYGYPMSITVDPAADVFDDELTVRISEFTDH